MSYVIGIDEVGRGPVAGPVVVCACAVQVGTEVLYLFPKGELKDSKKLSEKNRIHITESIVPFVSDKTILYGIGEVSALTIDEIGIVLAIKEAMALALKKVHAEGVEENSFIFLDGSLHADERFKQETIIRGDEKVLEIALASILAKVYRDTLMRKIGEEYSSYGFESHVGYGTKAHYKAIEKYGPTEYHRKSFLKNLLG